MSLKPIITFCIPTFNRASMIYELVHNILDSSNPNIEVVVMDNCSSDNTLERLNSIKDARLHIYAHDKQVSPFISWYDTLCKATGNWIFHINDRDWIDASKIDLLVDTLQELAIQNVGFAVAGEKISDKSIYHLYAEGSETLLEFALRHSHPTGQIIQKSEWDCITNKEDFFANTEKYGIYPHGYLYAIIGNHKKGAYILFDICDKAHYPQQLIKTVSTIYSNHTDKPEYFWPQNRFHLLLLAIENLNLITDNHIYKQFVLQRYYQFFLCVTEEWFSICNNPIIKYRYNRPDLSTNYLDLMVNGFDFISLFREYLENNHFDWADEEFYHMLCTVDQKLLAWLLTWTNELRSKLQ